jgi:hypothetical protein
MTASDDRPHGVGVTTITISPLDEGTDYARALAAGRRAGAKTTDAQKMAVFCYDDMWLLIGAFSPRLVWQGAQRRGLTTVQLRDICTAQDHGTIAELQLSE